jgi:hypothetical protein
MADDNASGLITAYVVVAQHPKYPEITTSTHISEALADKEAADITNQIRRDTQSDITDAAPETWRDVLDELQQYYPAQCWIEIKLCTLRMQFMDDEQKDRAFEQYWDSNGLNRSGMPPIFNEAMKEIAKKAWDAAFSYMELSKYN